MVGTIRCRLYYGLSHSYHTSGDDRVSSATAVAYIRVLLFLPVRAAEQQNYPASTNATYGAGHSTGDDTANECDAPLLWRNVLGEDDDGKLCVVACAAAPSPVRSRGRAAQHLIVYYFGIYG